jgi:hypothetical protein
MGEERRDEDGRDVPARLEHPPEGEGDGPLARRPATSPISIVLGSKRSRSIAAVISTGPTHSVAAVRSAKANVS